MDKKTLEEANQLQKKINDLDKRLYCALDKKGYRLSISCEFKEGDSTSTFYLSDGLKKKVKNFISQEILNEIKLLEADFNAL